MPRSGREQSQDRERGQIAVAAFWSLEAGHIRSLSRAGETDSLRNTPRGYNVRECAGDAIKPPEREENAMTISEYQVTGMTCEHCEMSVREEVGEIAGVSDIRVSAQTGRLVVTADSELDDAEVVAAVEEAGYRAVRV